MDGSPLKTPAAAMPSCSRLRLIHARKIQVGKIKSQNEKINMNKVKKSI
jgi:hypothetical protein